ncbi:MAG TPA: ASKHA domain-containing protein [Clostridia bacterium]|nr:ASKHA domain-containing protein [Clostridia bacterium]
MALISLKNKNITVEAEPGTSLADCIRMAGLHIETPCNGAGSCGKCRVKAQGALYQPTEGEMKLLAEAAAGMRLACMARVEGDVEIELPVSAESLNTINRGFSIDVEPDSDTKRMVLPAIDRGSSKPYMETLAYKPADFSLLEKIGLLERDNIEEPAGVVWEDRLLDIGEIPQVLGVAVDIGTTGISAYLVSLESGRVLSRASSLNPQTQYGGDVLTRISYCMNNADGSKLLKEAITKKIDEIIGELTSGGYDRDSVYRVAIAGNTTMLHLFLGVDTRSVALAPYRPVFTDRIDLKAAELSVNINKNGVLTLLPSASGYIGADIIAGITATGFNKKSGAAIFIDIGTNGEIAAINNGRIAATSTAAGPALEGMNISCGCRAEAGAIDSFSIDETYNISYTTIGGIKPRGICGSGLIDIAAFFVKREIVQRNGRFNPSLDLRVKDSLRDKCFYITDEIYISQKDIRQIQLAKGAIAAGIALLLEKLGLPLDKVEEAVIAGAFGYHINPRSIMDISLIPKGFRGKITFVGNSSVEGARLALINGSMLRAMEALKDEITVLELSNSDSFQECFINELNF